MNVVGIIAEYNPFHNGHQYHIEEAKKAAHADFAVVVMSGNFVQRGEPAVFDKYTRAHMALKGGADIVLQLPEVYSLGSAEYFAKAGVSILKNMNVVTHLVFGSDSASLDQLSAISSYLNKEPANYQVILKKYLKEGMSFPVAREKTLIELLPCIDDLKGLSKDDISTLLKNSNDILALEYLRALQSSKIKPIAIKRADNSYHDTDLSSEGFSSATSIRLHLKEHGFDARIKEQLPNEAAIVLEKTKAIHRPLFLDDFSPELYYALRFLEPEELASYADVSFELANRMKTCLSDFTDISGYISGLKNKSLTYSRISRSLMHILLKHPALPVTQANDVPYARLLGFQKDASPLLKNCNNAHFQIITKPANAYKSLSKNAYDMFLKDIAASDLYNQKVFEKYGIRLTPDYAHPLCILD
ncbi:MAG: nucleotidyltransferase family protein [Lachnospiraceae bacterium]|nr:nucleotidyltransferase family protein [Lachnospiraceae bacterium]